MQISFSQITTEIESLVTTKVVIVYCFLTSSSFSFLRLNLFTSTFYASCLLTANLFLTFATTRQSSVSQPAQPTRSYIEYTQIPSPIYQYVVNLVASLLTRRSSVVLVNVSVREHRFLNKHVFDAEEFTILKPLTLLSCCRLSIAITSLKIFSLPTFSLKLPNRIVMWYLGKCSKTWSNSS